jgi:hypothetical protein
MWDRPAYIQAHLYTIQPLIVNFASSGRVKVGVLFEIWQEGDVFERKRGLLPESEN